MLDRIERQALRTLGQVSTTEEDLEVSVDDDAIDALTTDDTGDHEGPDTAELDALDDSLVESIEDYTAGHRDASDSDDPDADTDDADTDDAGDTDLADAAEVEDDVEDLTENDVETDTGDHDGDVSSGALFVEDEYVDDFIDDDTTFDVPKMVAATVISDSETDSETETEIDVDSEIEIDVDSEIEKMPSTDAKESDGETPGVSPSILEELRRADIDGPVVDAAPQDDTSSGRRRPKKAIDYDPAPVPVPLKVPRILGRKPRVRKVTRVVRHVDPWSVFKIALLANLVLYVIVLTAGVLLWNVAYATGTVENVERFFESFGWQSFEFNGGELYHAAWIAGLFAVLGFTGLWVLLATLFNLITDVVGGVRFTVLEEEVVESRTSPMRRFVVRRPEPEIPAVLSDASGPMIREAIVDDTGDTER